MNKLIKNLSKMKFKNLKISIKMTILVLPAILGIIFIVMISIYNARSIGLTFQESFNLSEKSTDILNEINVRNQNIGNDVVMTLLIVDINLKNELIVRVNNNITMVSEKLDEYKTFLSEDEKPLFEELNYIWESYVSDIELQKGYFLKSEDDISILIARNAFVNNLDKKRLELNATMGKLILIRKKFTADRIESTKSLSVFYNITIVVASHLIILSCAIMSVLIIRSISRPLRKIVSLMEQCRKGDLSISILDHSEDEIGKLSFSFNEMVISLRKANENLSTTNNDLSHTVDTLKKTQMQLVQAEKMSALGRLVAGVAHEINTPIGVSVTAISFLAEKAKIITQLHESKRLKKSEMDNFLEIVNESANITLVNVQRAAELITSFKSVSADQSSEQRRRFKVVDYVNATLFSLKPKLNKTSHQVTVIGDENIEIYSYPGAFSQIITNLVINSLIHAFDPGTKGTIHIHVSIANNELELVYSDDGKGVKKENLDKIFDPFFTTNRADGGTGLGLHIIFNIVAQMFNGTIHCESVEGEGIRFLIHLPV